MSQVFDTSLASKTVSEAQGTNKAHFNIESIYKTKFGSRKIARTCNLLQSKNLNKIGVLRWRSSELSFQAFLAKLNDGIISLE